jgi:IclR family mhp operon transcriptional activator
MKTGVPIRSVSRSISILQAINRAGSLSMMAIARQGDVPYPTAFRIVQTLIHEGLIEQEPVRKRYRPTALIQSLAIGYQSESRLVDVGRRHISELTRKIGWPVLVSFRVGATMVVRDSTNAETSLTFDNCYPGYTLPLFTSATGRVCLAHMPLDEIDNLIRWNELSGKEEGTPFRLDDATVRALQKIREDGFAAKLCQRQNVTSNKTSSIAVPILRDGRSDAVLTMTYFFSAMKQSVAVERYVDILKQYANVISQEFSEAQITH